MKTSIQMRKTLTRLAIASALCLSAAAPAHASYALGFVQNETAGGVPNGDYNIDYNAYVADPTLFLAFSPEIAIGAASTLTFKVFVGDEYGPDALPDEYDQFSLWASTDGASLGYDILASSSPSLGGVLVPEWGGVPGYASITVNLSAFANQSIRLAFSFDPLDDVNNNFPGVRVDDILVTDGGATRFAENFESATADGWQLNGLWHLTGNVVPEPSMLSLLGACAIGFGLSRRRRPETRA
ncbi:MAG: PEP-CTERM sorting domain-containing protein [Rhodoferax sp.]|uniref:PEP-CTERM sorting domain-containing protein n=1 Tax=Rhodoferax sp. TaxID=50421 RepID=UPI002605947C|nr:PEP-CTERM sorting domain-containing protein [Rhodoferax sp.]MDD2879132.1 PEP-CTERM sorting domain-containing protein [Rhodoferax sp.]